MARQYYWAEINTGGRYPSDSGQSYINPQELTDALEEVYGDSGEIQFSPSKSWTYNYAYTDSGVKATRIILLSGNDIGTGFRVEYLNSKITTLLPSHPEWVDYVDDNAVELTG